MARMPVAEDAVSLRRNSRALFLARWPFKAILGHVSYSVHAKAEVPSLDIWHPQVRAARGNLYFLELAISSRESRLSPGVPTLFGLCETPNDESMPQREYILCEHTRLPIRPRAMPCRPLRVCGQIRSTDTEAFAGAEFRPLP